MDNKLGVLLALVLGAMVGYNWPVIKKKLTPLANEAEKMVIRGYLTVKDGISDTISDTSSHFRKVSKEVTKKVPKKAVAAVAKT